jgi:PAS domain S-box-containing protein
MIISPDGRAMLLVRKRRVHSWFLVHHLFANHPLPMLVYDAEALVVLDVNNAVMASYGHTREEVVGMHITRLLPPEDVPALLAIIHDTVRPGSTPYRPPMLWRHVYKNGHIRDVEIAAHDYDFDGRDAVLVSISDVTERLHAERERDALLAQLSHEVTQKAAIIEPSPDLAAATTAPVLQPRRTETTATAGLCILVVDDEPTITRMVAMMLGPHGHDLTLASSGEEALARLEAGSFDLILSDLGLGAGMNGWDLLDQVRQRASGTRFILSTGWGAQIDPADVVARGGEGLLAKPYRLTDLLHAIAAPS